MDEIRKKLGSTHPVYFTFDIDAIDPGFCPGTGKGHLTRGHVHCTYPKVIYSLYRAGHPVGNFVECNGVTFNFAEQIGYSSTFFQLVFQLLATVNKHHQRKLD